MAPQSQFFLVVSPFPCTYLATTHKIDSLLYKMHITTASNCDSQGIDSAGFVVVGVFESVV